MDKASKDLNCRRLVLILEHDNIRDDGLLADICIPVLKTYIDMVERKTAGNSGLEVLRATNGAKLTAIGTGFGVSLNSEKDD